MGSTDDCLPSSLGESSKEPTPSQSEDKEDALLDEIELAVNGFPDSESQLYEKSDKESYNGRLPNDTGNLLLDLNDKIIEQNLTDDPRPLECAQAMKSEENSAHVESYTDGTNIRDHTLEVTNDASSADDISLLCSDNGNSEEIISQKTNNNVKDGNITNGAPLENQVNDAAFTDDSFINSIENSVENDKVTKVALLDDSVTEFNAPFTETTSIPSTTSSTSFSAKEFGSKFSGIVNNIQEQMTQKTEPNISENKNNPGNSLKSSMFKVFRGVANSVNTEKVNENLNENFKQVYRNVLKNVSTGQGLINKLSNETMSKNSSSESLSSKLTSNDEMKKNDELKNAFSIDDIEDQLESDEVKQNNTVHINLKSDFYFDGENEADAKIVPGFRKMSANLDPNCVGNILSKTSSLQELSKRNSPALFRKTTQDSKQHQSNNEINTVARDPSNEGVQTSEDLVSSEEDMVAVKNGAGCEERTEHRLDETLVDMLSMERCELVALNKEDLMDGILKMKPNWKILNDHNKKLSREIDRLECNSSHQICQTQIEALEKQLQQIQMKLRVKDLEHQNSLQKQLSEHLNVRSGLTDRLELLTKQFQEANSNKESMVIKYAMAEKNVLVAQKQRDTLDKRNKELEKDKEVLLARVKNISSEKTRFMQILDKKLVESTNLMKEIEKQKEELNSRDVKLKWSQNKLKTEMENLKATQEKLETAQASISQHESELKQIKQEAEMTVQSALTDEENRANVLDKQVTEQKSKLIVENTCVRQLKEELQLAKSSLSSLTTHHSTLITEVTTLKQKLSAASAERSESEALFRSLQNQLQSAQSSNTALQHKLEQHEVLQTQLSKVQNDLESTESLLETERNKTSLQSNELELLHKKEAELLQFTQKLSEANSKVQSELNLNSEAERDWREEKILLTDELNRVKANRSDIKQKLTTELTDTKNRLEVVCKELKHQTDATSKLLEKVSELEGEITLMNKRHSNAVKDMSRELQKMRRKGLHLNEQQQQTGGNVGTLNSPVLSRPNSSCSLASLGNAAVPAVTVAPPAPEVSTKTAPASEVSDLESTSPSYPSVSPPSSEGVLSEHSRASSSVSLNNNVNNTAGENVLQPNIGNESLQRSELMAQRIIKLQKSLAKRQDKEEFLEEHVNQLVGELQKKNKIIDYFVSKEQPGVMTRGKDDIAKARMMQQKGIMASIYGSNQKDETMTLDLSLEINKKLQALFEDTLLKNITLKDSLNTLGDEVARLSMMNSARR